MSRELPRGEVGHGGHGAHGAHVLHRGREPQGGVVGRGGVAGLGVRPRPRPLVHGGQQRALVMHLLLMLGGGGRV